MYEIEKNVTFKKRQGKNPDIRKYPFYEMEVGDSFVVEQSEKEKVRVACYYHGKRNGGVFKMGYDSEGSPRCWRLE